MRKSAIMLCCPLVIAACASAPPANQNVSAQLIPVSDVELVSSDASAVKICNPEIVDERAALDGSCVYRMQRSPYSGKQIEAIGREKKELRSLCEHMWLPRCRNKY